MCYLQRFQFLLLAQRMGPQTGSRQRDAKGAGGTVETETGESGQSKSLAAENSALIMKEALSPRYWNVAALSMYVEGAELSCIPMAPLPVSWI